MLMMHGSAADFNLSILQFFISKPPQSNSAGYSYHCGKPEKLAASFAADLKVFLTCLYDLQ
jgi:hypothetical protein